MFVDLKTSPEQFHDMAARALEIVERYYAELPNMPVMPVTTASAIRDWLYEPLPQQGTTVADALATVRDVVYPLCRHNGHPRFFGYVASPGTAASVIGDFLAAALNANVTSWRSAPAAAEMEHLVVDWFKTMIGYDAGATGLLVSGGSMANFSGLAAARTAADPEMGRFGGGGRPALRIYVSDEGHFSIHKAARLLGIGSENVQSIPTDGSLRIDVAELERRINVDRKAGLRPMCIVANAGTVNTGAVDPIEELANIAARHPCGFTSMAPMAGFPRSLHRRSTGLQGLSGRIRFRLIHTSGYIRRWDAVAFCTAIRRSPPPRSHTTRNTRAPLA